MKNLLIVCLLGFAACSDCFSQETSGNPDPIVPELSYDFKCFPVKRSDGCEMIRCENQEAICYTTNGKFGHPRTLSCMKKGN